MTDQEKQEQIQDMLGFELVSKMTDVLRTTEGTNFGTVVKATFSVLINVLISANDQAEEDRREFVDEAKIASAMCAAILAKLSLVIDSKDQLNELLTEMRAEEASANQVKH